MILLVASTIAGAFFVLVNNGTTTSSSEGGEHDSGSIAGGISEVLVTLVKLTATTLVVLSLGKGLELLNSLKWKPAQE